MRGMGMGTVGMLAAALATSLAIAVVFTPDDDGAFLATETAMGSVLAVANSSAPAGEELADETVIAVLDTTYTALIELGGLAVSKAQDSTVRAIAGHTLGRDRQLRSEIRVLASQAGGGRRVADASLLQGHHEALEQLRMRSGRRFDRSYLDRTIVMNEALLDQVRQALATPVSLPIRAYLDRVASRLETDLGQVRQVRAALAGAVVASSS